MKTYEILKKLVSFNTIEDKENTKILNYIEEVLLQYGFKTEYKNKVLIMSNDNEANLGFLGHTDTVKIVDGWKSNPFEISIIDNNIYGLGVCDMKGGIAAFIDAVIQTDFSNLKHGVKLYFTYDEEIGFGGIYDIINSNEKFPKTMIFGEPTDNIALIGSKGLLEFELNFKGIKAHASEPNKGKSANINALKFLNKLNEFYEEKIKIEKDEKYEIPYTTMNIGMINGGAEKNSIPNNCFATLDFRPVNSEHINKIINKIDELSNQFDCEYKIIENINPFYNDIEFIKDKKTSNFITEASFVKKSNSIILGLGPVTAHEVNEHITVSSYEKIVNQYKDLIEKFCSK